MDYKDVVIDNNAIVNTEPAELPAEPYNIPQGEKPYLNPNPGYGEDGKTKPAIKTDLVEGEIVEPNNTVESEEGIRVERNPVNFVGGLFANGVDIADALKSIDAKQNKLYKHLVTFNVNGGGTCYGVFYSHIKNGTQAFTALNTGETIASCVQKGYGTQGTNPYFEIYTGIRKASSGNQATVYGIKITHYQDFAISGSNIQIRTNRFESTTTQATATVGSISTIEL